ncbi:hypothetical protein [Iodidimonas sp. SYSU 1G8]|uniref:hypothetical protein n=1 Tax=Iodidimonas sp. SYSU 1G8 TaxID=3133967 RepID=UPI0031FEBFA3
MKKEHITIYSFLFFLIFSYNPCKADIISNSLDYNVKVFGFTDPLFTGKKIMSIVVYAPDVPLDERADVEGAAVDLLKALGINATRGIEVIPPTRDDQADEILSSSEAEATLLVKTIELGFEERSTKTHVTKDFRTGEETTLPGRTWKTPLGKFNIELRTNVNRTVLWRATSVAKGNYKIGIAGAAISGAINTLRKDGLI